MTSFTRSDIVSVNEIDAGNFIYLNNDKLYLVSIKHILNDTVDMCVYFDLIIR